MTSQPNNVGHAPLALKLFILHMLFGELLASLELIIPFRAI